MVSMFVSSPNWYIVSLIPNVVVCGDGGCWEVIRSKEWSSHEEIGALIRRVSALCLVRRWLSISQEEGRHGGTLFLCLPASRTIIYMLQVYDIFLEQPEQIKTQLLLAPCALLFAEGCLSPIQSIWSPLHQTSSLPRGQHATEHL